MNIERITISELSHDPSNLRTHSVKNIEAIKASLRKFQQQKPLVVTEGNIVIAGNGTLDAARLLGWTEIDIVRTNLSGTDLTAFGIADNRTGELADWDYNALTNVLQGMTDDARESAGWGDFVLSDEGEGLAKTMDDQPNGFALPLDPETVCDDVYIVVSDIQTVCDKCGK